MFWTLQITFPFYFRHFFPLAHIIRKAKLPYYKTLEKIPDHEIFLVEIYNFPATLMR